MIIDNKYYEEISSEAIYGNAFIVIDDRWKHFYTNGQVIYGNYYAPPALVDIILICLEHEFKSVPFSDANIEKYKRRFNHLLQFQNRIELQILINSVLLELNDFIDNKLGKERKVR